MSKKSGVAKNTIKRYVEYFEAAFLIKTVQRVGRDTTRFQRANVFKVYLTNPSMRGTLFAPAASRDPALGPLAETGIYAPWFHSVRQPNDARWDRGEVDLVMTRPEGGVNWAVEVRWTDAPYARPREELRSLLTFCRESDLPSAVVTTRTVTGDQIVDGVRLRFRPTSVYCYEVGRDTVDGRALPTPLPGEPA